jgi:aryl-alcohol dehydrogenase-like predicted oxidoreductase
LRALDDLVRLGKVGYVGASEYASWQLAHAALHDATHYDTEEALATWAEVRGRGLNELAQAWLLA